MTREESIAIIRKEYLCVDRDCDIERSCGKCDLMMPSKEPILEAYKVAIEALEQEEDPYQADMDEAWNQVKHELESGFYHTEREEAISILSRPFDMSGVPAEILNAHKMAVEALEQEPCGDTISRQAVKDLIKSGISTDTYDDQEDVCKRIDDMPSVTPANSVYRKKAKRWKKKYFALKTEIEKIKAELISLFGNDSCSNECGCLDEVLQIIDRHTSGKEEETDS